MGSISSTSSSISSSSYVFLINLSFFLFKEPIEMARLPQCIVLITPLCGWVVLYIKII